MTMLNKNSIPKVNLTLWMGVYLQNLAVKGRRSERVEKFAIIRKQVSTSNLLLSMT